MNYQPNEPNNNGDEDCVAIYGNDGKWNDLPCTMKLPFICQSNAGREPG